MTTFNAKSYQQGVYVGAATFPGVIKRYYSADLEDTTNDASYKLTDGDYIKFFHLPPYAKVLSGRLTSGAVDLDDGGNTADLDLIVTDGTTTKTLVNGGTAIGQASATAVTAPASDNAYGFVTTDADFWAGIEVIATATGDAGANATIAAEIEYTLCLEPGEVSMRSGRDTTP